MPDFRTPLAVFLLTPALLFAATSPASAAPQTLKPKPVKCHKLQTGGQVCAKKPNPVKWSKGWWTDPTSYKVVDGNIYTEMEWEIPSDDYKAFGLTGYMSINAKKGFKGTLKFPARKKGVSASVMVAKPVRGSAYSEGGWTTKDGIYDCGVAESLGSKYAPTSLTGIVASSPKAKVFSIQWAIFGAPVRCGDEGPMNPTSPEIPSDAFTTRYPVSAFRKGEMIRLPVRGEWNYRDDSYGETMKITLGGYVVIKRVNNRIR